jgi:HEPN domain
MFQPKLFLSLAENLKNGPRDNLFESKIRTSVGRSYYSVFLATRSKIENVLKKELENRRDIHKTIITGLKKSKNERIAQYGTHLDSLQKYRHQADYRIRTNMVHNIAEVAYKLADTLFEELTTIPDEDLKSLFRDIQ